MRSIFLIMILSLGIVPATHADITAEIESIDRQMLQSCQTAQANAERSKRALIDTFLRNLTNLEKSYRNAGDQAAVLACQKSRAKYDPKAPPINRPTIIPSRLKVLVFELERQLFKIDGDLTKAISEAKRLRAGKLTAMLRGLVKRDASDDARAVTEALRSPPKIAQSSAGVQPSQTVVPKKVVYLTYDRPAKRWVVMSNQGVSKRQSGNITTVEYRAGKHGLLKVMWPDILEVGDRFSVEARGALSVEAVDLQGADANARISVPDPKKFATFEIVRDEDKITFSCDGKVKSTFYASGRLRKDAAREALVGTQLRAAFTIKKGSKASFRNATISRR